MAESDRFRAVYEQAGVYDKQLLPHYYDGVEDVELVARHLRRTFGPPTASLKIVEFGCGTGRVSTALLPYARNFTACDYSAVMVDAVREGFTGVETLVGDTRDCVTLLHSRRLGGKFDVVAAFWSLSYPIGEFFETMTPAGIIPVADPTAARGAADDFLSAMISLLAPGGRFLALYFDSDTPEQKLVTRAWERIAPFPGGDRSYTREIFFGGLRSAEDAGIGTVSVYRFGGHAMASDADTARAWFNVVHFKGMSALVDSPDLAREVDEFIAARTLESGEVSIPSGVYLVDFQRAPHPLNDVPTVRS